MVKEFCLIIQQNNFFTKDFGKWEKKVEMEHIIMVLMNTIMESGKIIRNMVMDFFLLEEGHIMVNGVEIKLQEEEISNFKTVFSSKESFKIINLLKEQSSILMETNTTVQC